MSKTLPVISDVTFSLDDLFLLRRPNCDLNILLRKGEYYIWHNGRQREHRGIVTFVIIADSSYVIYEKPGSFGAFKKK